MIVKYCEMIKHLLCSNNLMYRQVSTSDILYKFFLYFHNLSFQMCCEIANRSQRPSPLYYNFVAYYTAGSSRDGEPTMPEALLDNKHEMDDWRHVDTVSLL